MIDQWLTFLSRQKKTTQQQLQDHSSSLNLFKIGQSQTVWITVETYVLKVNLSHWTIHTLFKKFFISSYDTMSYRVELLPKFSANLVLRD